MKPGVAASVTGWALLLSLTACGDHALSSELRLIDSPEGTSMVLGEEYDWDRLEDAIPLDSIRYERLSCEDTCDPQYYLVLRLDGTASAGWRSEAGGMMHATAEPGVFVFARFADQVQSSDVVRHLADIRELRVSHALRYRLVFWERGDRDGTSFEGDWSDGPTAAWILRWALDGAAVQLDWSESARPEQGG